ncbi:MAG: carbon monoxide dehydrogenase subunit G [Chloroflexi bacterium]|nr:carbon monoxide dehydrogenase subunit G [Chloroflexota bacterium]
MKVTHTVLVNAPVDQVWKVLLDPQQIAGCIPGCDGLTPLGEDQYEAVMRVGVGSVKGTFRSKISLRDIQPPSSYRMVVEGQGAIGVVNGEGLISLAAEGAATHITVDGDANVGGTIAAVGQRMLAGAARIMMTQFFGCLARKVEDV